MPTYEYRCDKCGHREDHIHRGEERAVAFCPTCENTRLVWCFPAPALRTGTRFMSGQLHKDEFDGNAYRRSLYEAAARKAGVNPTGKKYMAGLARFQRDPEAWVADDSDVRRTLRNRGWGCEGSISVKPATVEVRDDQPYRPAESLVEEEVNHVLGDNKVSAKERADIKDATTTRLAGVQ